MTDDARATLEAEIAAREAQLRAMADELAQAREDKATGVEPYAYFADVLARTATASPRELTPRAWKAARERAAASDEAS